MTELEAAIFLLESKPSAFSEEIESILIYGVGRDIIKKCDSCSQYLEAKAFKKEGSYLNDACKDCEDEAKEADIANREESEWLDNNR